jgi:membrane protein implicated in regulation of membrane protease activity
MAKMNKMHILSGLLVFLILVLLISPSLFRNMYSSVLGRIMLVVVVIFFAMNSVTLGLFSALIIIIASNMFYREGLDNMDTTSTSTTSTPVDSAIEDKKEKADAPMMPNASSSSSPNGVDLETIKQAIQPQSSTTLPVAAPSSTENVSPSSTEPFSSMYESV